MPGLSPLRGRALLFDLDGVLADSRASVEAHWRRWAGRHELDADALLRIVHGRRALDTIRAVAPHLDADAALAHLVAAEAGDTAGVVAAPGAAVLLGRLPPAGRTPAAWAVVTSGVRAVAEARLRACGLPTPPLIVAADEIARGKPDPEGYLAAAARLGRRPAECVVVEDAPAGVAAARAAGMPCVALTTTHRAEAVAGAALVAPSLAGLRVEIGPHPDGGVAYTLTAGDAVGARAAERGVADEPSDVKSRRAPPPVARVRWHRPQAARTAARARARRGGRARACGRRG